MLFSNISQTFLTPSIMSGNNDNLYEFGQFRLDTGKKVLWHDGKVVSLPLKAIELLSVLVEHRGEVVTKNALMEKVWGDAFVAESVLTQNIYLLRKTLSKIGGKKNLIQNVPRRGYLFSGQVTEINGAELVIERHLFEQVRLEETTSEDTATRRHGDAAKDKISLQRRRVAAAPRRRISWSVITAALILSVAATGAYFYFRNASAKKTSAPPKARALLPIKPLAAVSPVKSLAVLPLESADENLSNTFTNDLTSRLGSLNKCSVRPFALVRKQGETGAELQVDFVLGGTIGATKNNRLRVEARMTDTRSNAEIWKQRFDETDIIRLEDAIANQTAQAILNQLSPDEQKQAARRLPTNIAAYETYVNGYLLWRRRGDGVAQSIPYFQKAIELDASFAEAYAGLASAKAIMGVKDSPAAREAESALNRAYELDDTLADAYAAQGFIQIFHHWDWQGAEASLRRALQLDPNCINAHHWLGVFFSIHRRLDEAKAEMQKALELDPTSPILTADLGQLYYFAGDRDAAIEFYNKALALEPNHQITTGYLNQLNRPREIGNKEAVLKQLSRAAEAHVFILPYINVDPLYDSLRDDPRFQAILRKMGLAM